MKTAIIGYSGSGKSTMAGRLGALYGCPVLYLDRVHFLPGWKERDVEECRAIVGEFMEQESWAIDGNYSAFFLERRLEEADRILFFNFPRVVCFVQAYGRYLRTGKRVRESMAEGCTEKFDFEFMKWILWEGRSRKRRERFAAICKKYPEKVVVLKSRREADRWFLAEKERVGKL